MYIYDFAICYLEKRLFREGWAIGKGREAESIKWFSKGKMPEQFVKNKL